MTKEMVNAVKEERAALVARVKQIDAFLSLYGIGVAVAPAKKSHKKAVSGSDRAKKAWATKKRNAAQANGQEQAGASLLEAVS